MTPRPVAVALAVAGLLLSPVASATMHFSVVRSAPAAGQAFDVAPKRLQIWFSQVPAPGVSRLTLLGAEKKEIPLGKTEIDKETKSLFADVPKAPAAGAYTIVWRAAGDDGHAMSGEIPFTVAPESRSANPAATDQEAPANCVTIGKPKPTAIYTVRHSESTGAVTQVINQWEAVTDKGSRVRVTAPAGLMIMVNEHHIVDDVAVLDKMSKLNADGGVIESTSFRPGIVGDPAFRACTGRSWQIPPVTAMFQSTRNRVTSSTPAGTLRIVSIRERVTVPAGTFDTVHYIRTSQSTDEYWKSLEHGVVVKHIAKLATGAVTEVLLSIK